MNLPLVLDDKDIIQIDATLSAGVLIFLTLSNIIGVRNPAILNVFLTLMVIIPFSVSAILIVFENDKQGRRYEKRSFKRAALWAMAAGFIYLAAMVLFLLVESFGTHR